MGNASSPFSSPCFPFFQPERNEDGSSLFGETQPFLSNRQHELHFRASLIVFSPVHHQNGPNKKPHFSLFHCEFYLPFPFDLPLSSSISFWPYVCSDLETDGSSISLDRERRIPRRLCVWAQKCKVCRGWSSKVWVVLGWCLPHSHPASGCLEPAGLGCFSSFLQPTWCSQLGFEAQLSNVYLSHLYQAGDSNANIATPLAELSDRIWPKLQREEKQLYKNWNSSGWQVSIESK